MQMSKLAPGWLALGLWAGVLGASPVAHASRDTTDFQLQGNYTGDASGLTLSTTIVPATVDRGMAGSFCVGRATRIRFCS
jgi:hypothetical protein